jgi:acyl phosphate:glycerol-3-phosphate acyltransferase
VIDVAPASRRHNAYKLMLIYVIVAVVSYLLGSIPFGYILVRLFRGEDVRSTGSGNIGATNVMRSGSKGLGIATLILDAAKGFAAVWFARALGTYFLVAGLQELWDVASWPERRHYLWLYCSGYMAVAGVFAILGHIYPVWLKFKGGKGVATGVGVFLAIAPKAVGLVLIIFVAIVWLSRYISLASIIATATFPLVAWAVYRNSRMPSIYLASGFAAILIIAKHHQNIRRLLAGTENRFGSKKGANA